MLVGKKLGLILGLFACVSITACKDKTPENQDEKSETNTLTISPENKAYNLGKSLFEGKGMCASCHLKDKKVIGPSIQEIVQTYDDKNASIVTFLQGKGEPIVDPSQYEIMKANFSVTKTMSEEELKAIETYMYSFKK
uniref:c-type cytochrome n=1 Tax=Flavobacterium sp. TaxID=239 RepID=UPI0040499EC7